MWKENKSNRLFGREIQWVVKLLRVISRITTEIRPVSIFYVSPNNLLYTPYRFQPPILSSSVNSNLDNYLGESDKTGQPNS